MEVVHPILNLIKQGRIKFRKISGFGIKTPEHSCCDFHWCLAHPHNRDAQNIRRSFLSRLSDTLSIRFLSPVCFCGVTKLYQFKETFSFVLVTFHFTVYTGKGGKVK